MKSILAMAITLAMATTFRLHAGPTATVPVLVDDPVAAIRSILPAGWEIQRVVEHTYPSYRPQGDGRAIFLGSPRQVNAETKPGYEAVLYLMPKDYEDGGVDPTHGEAQSYPARLVATTDRAKLYFWGSTGPASAAWDTIADDLLKAVVKK